MALDQHRLHWKCHLRLIYWEGLWPRPALVRLPDNGNTAGRPHSQRKDIAGIPFQLIGSIEPIFSLTREPAIAYCFVRAWLSRVGPGGSTVVESAASRL